MSFGDPERDAWKLPAEDALPLLKAAYDRGINTWDTAGLYSHGVSEEIIGQAIRHYQLPRHRLVIMTKCHFLVMKDNKPATQAIENPEETAEYINQSGLSRKAIFYAVDQSLKRMGLDYIDVLQIHRFDPTVPAEETMKALHDLVECGKVRYIGASSMRAVSFAGLQHVAEKNSWTKFISMQSKYNLLYREEEREMNFFCNTTGVGLVPWGPVDKGRLARPVVDYRKTIRSGELPDMRDADIPTINRVEELAKKKGWSMTQVALAWLNPLITSPIIGFSKVERMDEAIAANSMSLTEEERAWLEELYQPRVGENAATPNYSRFRPSQ